MGIRQIFLAEIRDYIECFVIPAMAVILPWWLAFRVFRLLAHAPFLYRLQTQGSFEGANYLGLLGDNERAWRRAAKVAVMVDYADVFLLATRGNSYLSRYCDEQISPQLRKQQIIFTPHYGAGGWLYALLLQSNHQVAVLINSPPPAWRAQNLIGRLRLAVLRRLGVLVMPPEDILSLRTVMRQNITLVVMPDIPKHFQTAVFRPATELGKLNLAAGFFELATNRNIPVMFTALAFNPHSGRREFSAQTHRQLTAEQYAEQFALFAVAAIKKYSSQWRMLVVAPQVMLPHDNCKEPLINAQPKQRTKKGIADNL